MYQITLNYDIATVSLTLPGIEKKYIYISPLNSVIVIYDSVEGLHVKMEDSSPIISLSGLGKTVLYY